MLPNLSTDIITAASLVLSAPNVLPIGGNSDFLLKAVRSHGKSSS